MIKKPKTLPKNMTMLLVYGRLPLVFAGMLCAMAVMWTRSATPSVLGVIFLLTSMSFDLVDGWFAARFIPNSKMAELADRMMDKLVYSIIFPLIAVGMMWRLSVLNASYTRIELLHAIFVMILCITILIRDNFAHFMRGFAIRRDQELEIRELIRIRTIVAAPLGAILYAYAFYIPVESSSVVFSLVSWPANLSLRHLFIIEIIFLILNFGSIAGFCRRYGSICLDELCLENKVLRRRILSVFPNALTTMNAIMGLLAIFFAEQGRIKEAYLFIIGATIFDKLDGSMARKLGLTESLPDENRKFNITFGGLLDDFADSISFCIAPACIFYICLSQFANNLIPIILLSSVSIIYALAGISRLIYFTFDTSPIPGFFKGMPTPAAALFVLAPLIIFSQFAVEGSALTNYAGYLCTGLMGVAAVLMNLYLVKYLHMGRYMDKHPLFARVNLILILVFLFTPFFGYVVFIQILLYVFSPMITWRVDQPPQNNEGRLA